MCHKLAKLSKPRQDDPKLKKPTEPGPSSYNALESFRKISPRSKTPIMTRDKIKSFTELVTLATRGVPGVGHYKADLPKLICKPMRKY